MARGWESKSVEQQIEDAQPVSGHPKPAPDKRELFWKREGLLLQRSRVLQEIESARNPRYRRLLEEMLSHLDGQLSLYS